ncbi:MAG: phosphoenolpyruvate mutase [Planctomycetes bacterium]|nr:phosphoenolpyruvate mutase [Planctomycetota bacterium]
MRKTAALRNLLRRPELAFVLEAHDGVSARIVEEAGFQGIWASGLTMSASMGVRDNNEASWTQVLEKVEFMADATSIPILLDGDTGHGNFNNVRRFVRKLEQRGVAGVCIEDKLFPKTNSFIKGEQQPLADPEEFAGRIKAAKDSQVDADFQVVARVEALIAGWPMEEALSRAETYEAAGADAILIHSKRSTPDEVIGFRRAWGDRLPVVIVPTMYYATPPETLESEGFSLVIWANHLLRSGITAMEQTARTIAHDRSLFNVEGEVASVKRIFELQGAAELADAETRYLPESPKDAQVVVLAASRDPGFGALTEDQPKCMIEVGGRPLLGRQLDIIRSCGLRDLVVVRGWKAETVAFDGVRYVQNDDFDDSSSAWSLQLGLPDDDVPLVVAYGDIVYRKHVLRTLLDENADVAVVVDLESRDRHAKPSGDYVKLAGKPQLAGVLEDEPLLLERVAGTDESADGEMIGLLKTSRAGTIRLKAAMERLQSEDRLRHANLSVLVGELLAMDCRVRVVPITGNWVDVNDLGDLAEASSY